ncbi:MAG: chemotaxis protein CheC [Sporolactobacillus sp.]
MYEPSDLGDAQLDFLKEVGNIGAGHAADALSQLLGKPIDMKIPSVNVLPLNELISEENEKQVAASYIGIEGDIKAYFFMIFELKAAERLVGELVPADTSFDSELAQSAFCEIANILCGSYLTALAAFLKIQISQTPPAYAADMEGAILGEGLAELSLYDDEVILIDALLFDREAKAQLKGEFYFLPVANSLAKIIKLTEGKSFL